MANQIECIQIPNVIDVPSGETELISRSQILQILARVMPFVYGGMRDSGTFFSRSTPSDYVDNVIFMTPAELDNWEKVLGIRTALEQKIESGQILELDEAMQNLLPNGKPTAESASMVQYDRYHSGYSKVYFGGKGPIPAKLRKFRGSADDLKVVFLPELYLGGNGAQRQGFERESFVTPTQESVEALTSKRSLYNAILKMEVHVQKAIDGSPVFCRAPSYTSEGVFWQCELYSFCAWFNKSIDLEKGNSFESHPQDGSGEFQFSPRTDFSVQVNDYQKLAQLELPDCKRMDIFFWQLWQVMAGQRFLPSPEESRSILK